jgi:hypothetical protein
MGGIVTQARGNEKEERGVIVNADCYNTYINY